MSRKSKSSDSAPLRGVRPAKEGKAGFEVQGMPHTYDETTAKRLQYMDEDGEFHFPEDGVLAEVATPVDADETDELSNE